MIDRDFWRERRVFVTGATGIVGSWLVRELLGRNANVAVLVRDADPQSELLRSGDLQRCTVFNGTVEDLWTLERAISLHEAEYVFHLAAQTIVGVAHRNPFTTFETNVRGTYNLLEASRMHASLVRGVIVASSDKAYGEVDALPYVETMPLRGRHPYEVSKSCTDLIAASYSHTYGVPVTIARCGNIYGGGDLNWSRIVPGTIRSLLRGERPTLRSDGTFRRDYIYVKDVARAYMSERAEPRAAIIGAGLMGCWHADAVRRVGGRVTLIVDSNDAARDALGRRHPEARLAADVDASLLARHATAAHVCTPAATHLDIASTAIEAGLHTLVEKPFATNADETARLLALAEQRGVIA